MADFRALTLQAGTYKQIQDGQNLIVGSGVITLSGDLAITPAGTNVTIASGKTLLSGGGAGAFDFSPGSGIFKTSTGAVTIGGGASTVAITSSAAAITITAGAASVWSTTAGNLTINAAAALLLGPTSTSVSIGSVGVLTTVLGDFTVNGTETVVGNTTFQSNVIFGDAATDTVQFVARVLDNFHFLKEVNHTIDVDASTTAATAGGNLSILSGAGSTTGNGGVLALTGGVSGAGATGNGGAITIVGGAAASTNGNGGAVTINGGALTGTGVNGVVSIGTATTSAVNIGASGTTTTVTGNLTQLTGAFSITGNAASQISTTAGALTLTSAAAATWSTAAGALTLNGTGGMNLQGGAVTALAINSTGTTITVQAGALLTTTGTGNINLPNNASARFQIETVAVSANVTAANLGTLTAGPASDASGLHTHTGLAVSSVVVPGTSGEALAASAPVVFDDAAGTAKVFRADADGAGELVSFVGANVAAVGAADLAVTVQVAGEISVADALWTGGVPAVTDVGKKVFLSETIGTYTLTAPATTGSTVIKVAIVTRGGTGAVKINIQVGDGVVL